MGINNSRRLGQKADGDDGDNKGPFGTAPVPDSLALDPNPSKELILLIPGESESFFKPFGK
jgi:hypothetical protein